LPETSKQATNKKSYTKQQLQAKQTVIEDSTHFYDRVGAIIA
jgi:hypothetical protein